MASLEAELDLHQCPSPHPFPPASYALLPLAQLLPAAVRLTLQPLLFTPPPMQPIAVETMASLEAEPDLHKRHYIMDACVQQLDTQLGDLSKVWTGCGQGVNWLVSVWDVWQCHQCAEVFLGQAFAAWQHF